MPALGSHGVDFRVQPRDKAATVHSKFAAARVRDFEAQRASDFSAVPASNASTSPYKRPRKARVASALYPDIGDRHAAQARTYAEQLLSMMPPASHTFLLGGAMALLQIPDANERHERLIASLCKHGGAKGDNIASGVKSLEALYDYCQHRGVPPLPASTALVASVCKAEGDRATREAVGSRGGQSVYLSTYEGFVFLSTHARMPIAVDGDMPTSSIPPPQKGAAHHAGSLPVPAYCQAESVAARAQPSCYRYFCRSVLCVPAGNSTRLIDAIRGKLLEDAVSPAHVIYARSPLTKDGDLIDLNCPAEGFLGPYTWLAEHIADVTREGYLFPDFICPKGHAGDVRFATSHRRMAITEPHLRSSIRAMLQDAPLSMSDSELDQLDLLGHSWHGTYNDIIMYLVAQPNPQGFSLTCGRISGHWSRRLLDAGSSFVASARTGHPLQSQVHAMQLLYSSGVQREGYREQQLSVRLRFVLAVRAAIARAGCHWSELPRARGSMYAFLRIP